jgi:hypothetical protein
MKLPTKIAIWGVGAVTLLIGLSLARLAWEARRPSNMPTSSAWIDAPAVPFGFYRGWWFGCWIDSDGRSNRCRLWGPSLSEPIVYEGIYISCDSKLPVSVAELQPTAPPMGSFGMWVGDSAGKIFAPAAFLRNGKVLVPVQIPSVCDKFQRLPELFPQTLSK